MKSSPKVKIKSNKYNRKEIGMENKIFRQVSSFLRMKETSEKMH